MIDLPVGNGAAFEELAHSRVLRRTLIRALAQRFPVFAAATAADTFGRALITLTRPLAVYMTAKATYLGLTKYGGCASFSVGAGPSGVGRIDGPKVHGRGVPLPWQGAKGDHAGLFRGSSTLHLPLRCGRRGLVHRTSDAVDADRLFTSWSMSLIRA
jgi:hypothetical protein